MGSKIEALVRNLLRTDGDSLHLVPGQRIYLTKGVSRAVVGREALSMESFCAVAQELVPGVDPGALAAGRQGTTIRIDPLLDPVEARFGFQDGQPALVIRRIGAVGPEGTALPDGPHSAGEPSSTGDVSFHDVELEVSTRLAESVGAYRPPRPSSPSGSVSPLDSLLAEMNRLGASDAFLLTGFPAAFRIGGELRPLRDFPPLDPARVAALLEPLLGGLPPASGESLIYGSPHGRVGVRVLRDANNLGMSIRKLVAPDPTSERAVPPDALRLTEVAAGILLVSAPLGPLRAAGLVALGRKAAARQTGFVVVLADRLDLSFDPGMSLRSERDLAAMGGSAGAIESSSREGASVIVVEDVASGRDVDAAAVAVVHGAFVVAGAAAAVLPRLKAAAGADLVGMIETDPAGSAWRVRVGARG